VERVGRTSVQIRYDGSVKGRPVFRARNTMVAVDMATFRPTPLPEALRASFLAATDPSATSGDTPGARA
jgi:acyl-CoA thioesterase FadM